MSRTHLCFLTGGVIALLSLGMMVTRYSVVGGEIPAGPNTWKVIMTVQGAGPSDAKVLCAAPLDFGHQHVLREQFTSNQMHAHPAPDKQPDRRQVLWTRRGAGSDTFRVRAEYTVALDVIHPSSSMARLERGLTAAPKMGEYLDPSAEGDEAEKLAAKATELTESVTEKSEQARALFDFVSRQIQMEPSLDGPDTSAGECLKNESGDSGAKARLLVSLFRHCNIPARLVSGVVVGRSQNQRAHYWAEAWIGRWMPMCPTYHHYGQVPPTYLTLTFGDQTIVKGRGVKNLDYGILVERATPADLGQANPTPLRGFFLAISLHHLPPTEQRLIEFLLLLPVAALIICVFRNLIGMNSFGTFAPALVGLALREMPLVSGMSLFCSILLIGWVLRRVLDRFHLLQVPRIALMLSLIVVVMIVAITVAHAQGISVTRYFSLFPMIILTGMIERFWTLETEDSTSASFRTLLCTMFISGTIALALGATRVAGLLFDYPEILGLMMALQLLIGRYTGFRLSELFRFRDFMAAQTTAVAGNA